MQISHHGSKGVGSFCYWRVCFSELQNITYTEGTVLLIFSKDDLCVSDLSGYTQTAKRRMRPCYVPSISKKVGINGF